MKKIQLYDTTLRDGEQTPGVRFSHKEKMLIAEKLADAGISMIEAGFPAVSREEFQSVKDIASSGIKSDIVALCRLKEEDIDLAAKTGVKGVFLFIATSPLHLKHKLNISRDELIKTIRENVSDAVERGFFVQFSAEDATRTPPDFLYRCYQEAIINGAHRIGVADTVSCMYPSQFRSFIEKIRARFNIPVSVHCHNDFGLATANTLAAIEAGASAASVSVNGIGERCGNASLEEVATALEILYNIKTGIDLSKLNTLSHIVEKLSEITISKLKPVVGEYAFTHESGIHVAAVIKNPKTYEPYDPEVVGNKRKFIFGKHTGYTALEYFLRNSGISISAKKIDKLLKKIKKMRNITEDKLVDILRNL